MLFKKWNIYHDNNFQNSAFLTAIEIVQFQKISILPPQKGLEFPGGVGGSVRPKNLKKCMKLNWNFQRGGGVLEKIPSWGRYGYFLELHIYKKKKVLKIIHSLFTSASFNILTEQCFWKRRETIYRNYKHCQEKMLVSYSLYDPM